MIDLAILGLLTDQELHGYELKKRLVELLGPRTSVSFGSLYPALARLEKAGFVKTVEARTNVDRPVPSSGSLAGELAAFRARRMRTVPGGRGRKVYGITERGETRLTELLNDPAPGDDRMFAVRLAFCSRLTASERLALFERRRGELTARRTDRTRRPGEHQGPLDRYLHSLREHDAQSISHDIAWLDGLIEAERQAHTEGTQA